MAIPIIPNTIAGNAEIDITWASSITTSEGGVTGRRALRKQPLRQFTITIGPDDVLTMIGIYNASYGPRYPVALRDWSNYQFANQVLSPAVGGGYQLSQTWTPSSVYSFSSFSNSESFTYPVLLPDQSEVPLQIFVNGTPTGFTLNDYGIVTGVGGGTITATGEYLVPCCFLQDSLTIKQITGSIASMEDIQLREILLTDLQTLLASIP
jgi:hypothetical protein